jgi:anti-sigma B factor antagonist
MYSRGPVIVMELPERLQQAAVKAFLASLQPLIEVDRPCIVLDCSKVQHMDSAGVQMLLHCLEEAMKRDGDLKLAAVPPASAIVMELMRVDRLFEVFETTDAAARSFHSFAADSNSPSQPWYSISYGPNGLKAAN